MSVKISELPSLETLADNDILAGVDTSEDTTSKITLEKIKNYATEDVYDKEEVDNTIDALQTQIDSLSTIYNAFPTVSDEGESMTLEDTAEVTFKKLDLKGNTSQVQYTGKNLFNSANVVVGTKNGITCSLNSDGSIKLVGTATAYTPFDIPTTLTGTYTVSCDNWGSFTLYFQNSGTSANANKTLSGDVSNIVIGINNGTTINKSIKIQIEQGSTATSYEPYVGGTASPNPSYPQPIQVVSGDNEINVVGKNLIPTSDIISASGTISNGITFTRNSDGSITANGTATSGISIYINANYTKLPAGTYTFSDSVPSGESGTTFFLYADVRHTDDTGWDAYNFSTANTTTGMTQTIPEAFKFKTRIVIRSGQTLNNVVFKPMLEKNSSTTSYEPYQVDAYNIDLPVENLCDVILDSSISGDISYKTYTFKPNTQYTISTNTWVTSSSTANIFASAGTSFSPSSATNGVNGSRTITSDSNGKITIGYRNVNLSLDYSSGDYYVQIELGSKANSYTPYGTTPIELCKIGDYQDYIYKDNGSWYLHKEIGKVELDGSERGWGRSGASTSSVFVGALNLNQYGIGIYSKQNTASSWLTNGFSYGTLGDINKFSVYNPDTTYGYNNIGFGISTDIVNDLEAFKTWVSSNNLVFYYILANPTNTEITDTTLLEQLEALKLANSYESQTNISQENNDKPFILDVEAIKKLS